jgi:hypothetical protein
MSSGILDDVLIRRKGFGMLPVVGSHNLAEDGEGVSEARTWRGSGRNTTPKVCGRHADRNEKTEGGGLASEVSVVRFGKRREATYRSGWRFLERGWWGFNQFVFA